MKFITHNDEQINTNGTHLQGYITVDYNKLCDLLGKSQNFDGYKSDWEWDIEFADGTVATIYNWKNGPNYGYEGVTADTIKEWNVGGFNQQALKNVKEILSLTPGKYSFML